MPSADIDVRLDEPGAGVALTAADLEPLVAQVEIRLQTLADSLRERDVLAIELQAQALHRALALAVEGFMAVTRNGGVPVPMRTRLAQASAQLARQREGLSRATAALDRAIDVLMPGAMPAAQVYNASGLALPMQTGGSYNA